MKRGLAAAASLVLLASLGAWAQAPGKGAKAAGRAPAGHGGQLFMERCSVCHLPPGGGAQMAPRLNKSSMGGSEAGIAAIIANGSGSMRMPAFKNQLTEAEIASIAAYVKTLN